MSVKSPRLPASCESLSLSLQLLAAGAPAIHHGEPLTDRKSTFQAHVAQVHSKEEVSWYCAVLYCSHTSLYAVQCCIVAIHYLGKRGALQIET